MRCKQMRIVQLTFVFLFFALVRVSGTPPVSNDVDLSGAMQQGIVVTGTVSDQEGSLPGVSVAVKGTTQGVVTDLSGKFTITVPNRDAVLIFSFVGYVTQEIEVGDRRIIDLRLDEDVKQIEEVVVVGYAVQKKATLVGSVSQAIQGMMPGVVATVNTGLPGKDAASILIRGKGTWKDSKGPLCLVDGVERDFNDIDPNEIETISVLKDAAATAVYGVKGGNGVIIVTTKRGTTQRPSVSLTANFGFKNPTLGPQYTDYVTSMKMWNEAVRNDGMWDYMIDESMISAWENAYATGNYGPHNDYFPQVDWWDEMIKWGYQQQYNLNVRGGGHYVKYFVSFGYLNDGDIFRSEKQEKYNPAFWYKRYNWRTNLDFTLSPSTLLSVNLAGKQGNRNQAGFRGNTTADETTDNNFFKLFFQQMYNGARNLFPIRWNDNGEFGCSGDGYGNIYTNFLRGQRMHKYYENFIDLGLKQDLDFITKGLSANIKFSYTTESETQSRIQEHEGVNANNFGAAQSDGHSIIRYYRRYDYSNPQPDGSYPIILERRFPDADFQGATHLVAYDLKTDGGYGRRMKYEGSLNYARSFGKHAVSALGVFERYENNGLKSGSNTNLKVPEREEAWVARATYNFDERYLFEFSGSYTGSMRFARGLRFKFFPAYSVGWRISEEPFIKNSGLSDIISNLKIRYSYGTVGYDRNADFFTYIQTFSVGADNSGYQFGENSGSITRYGPFITEEKTANVKASWETAYKQNLGLDFGFFNNKLTGTFELFKEDREGIIMTAIKPAWFGIKDPDANIGKTKNHGLEIELGWNSKLGDDFRYWVKANFAANENRIVDRNDPPAYPEFRKEKNKPIDVQRRMINYGYYESLDDIYNYASHAWQKTMVPGDLLFIDYDGDGNIINADANDRPPMKNLNHPHTTYGWSMGFNWKNFEFSMMWYGVLGVYKNLEDEILWDLRGGENGIYSAWPNVTDRWTPETAAWATKPALHTITALREWNDITSTYKYRNASYLRMKNFEIAYSLNKKFISKLGMSKCQIYANGNNLLTFTKFSKYTDPEGNSATTYPMVRRYNVGVRIGFN